MGEAHLLAVRFRLQDVLDERGLSQSELSRRSGVSIVTVNGIANNRTSRVDLATLDALCEALGIAPGDLLEHEPEKPRRRKSA